MTWLTDNPERAGRITQLGAQINEINARATAIDTDLANKDLTPMLDDILKGQSSYEFLQQAGRVLNENSTQWSSYFTNYQSNHEFLDLAAMLVGIIGAEKAWVWLQLPEQVTLNELASSMFFKGAGAPFKALTARVRAIGRPVAPLEEMKPFKLGPVAQEQWAERVASREATEQIAFGGRIWARFFGAALDVAAGVAFMLITEAAVQWYEKGGYVDAEHEASICRLAAKRRGLMFEGLNNMIMTMESLHTDFKEAEKTTDPVFQKHDMQKFLEKRDQMADEMIKQLQAITYENAATILHEQDVHTKPPVYMEDDLDPPELVRKTKEYIAKKAAELLAAQHNPQSP